MKDLQSHEEQVAELEARHKKQSHELSVAAKNEQAAELKSIDLMEEMKVLEFQLDDLNAKINQLKENEADLRSQVLLI